MKRRDFLKFFGIGLAASVATRRTANARVCERNVGTLRAIYPVGAIYISTTNVDPADLFGFGTWARFAQGSTLVGVQVEALPGFPLDPDFNFSATFQRRGAKTHTLTLSQTPAHTHDAHHGTFNSGVHGTSSTATGVFSRVRDNSGENISNNGGARVTINAPHNTVGSGHAHNNLPPYITVFIWRRSA